MPLDVMAREQVAAKACELLIAVGSSLGVEPAVSFARVAKAAGRGSSSPTGSRPH